MKFFANAYTKSGIPDLLVCCNGWFLAVEVKATNGKPSELQKYNIRKIIQGYGYGVILYPDQFDDFKEMLRWIGSHHDDRALRIMDKINERWDK